MTDEERSRQEAVVDSHLEGPWAILAEPRNTQYYEGESTEDLKKCDKNSNHTSRLSYKLRTMILMVLRVADRWQYDTT